MSLEQQLIDTLHTADNYSPALICSPRSSDLSKRTTHIGAGSGSPYSGFWSPLKSGICILSSVICFLSPET